MKTITVASRTPRPWTPEARLLASWAAGLLVGGALAGLLAWLGCPVEL